MDAVKPGPHLAELSGRLLEELRRALLADEPDALRPSHHRLLDAIPPAGRSISDLAAALRMTKQGAGQLAAALEAAGLVVVRPDASDGRRRLVVRTEAGERRLLDVRVRLDRIERRWAHAVGETRYAVFRAVLDELGRGVRRDDEVDAGDPGRPPEEQARLDSP